MKIGIVSRIKSMLVSDSSRVRKVPVGLYKGLRLDINLRSETQLFLGFWERETHWAIRRAATKAKWFIDVGAGKGELCVFFARLKHVKRIIAIEPNHASACGLIVNLTYNNIASNRVEVFEKFAGTTNDDRFVQIDKLDLPSTHGFIKVDVDGVELDVLLSAHQLLSQADADLLIETHADELEKCCIEYLKSLGYVCRVIKNAWWRVFIPEQRPVEHNRWLFAELGPDRPLGRFGRWSTRRS